MSVPVKLLMKGLGKLGNYIRVFYCIFSKGNIVDISDSHLPTFGLVMFFHDRALTLFAKSMFKSHEYM